LRVQANRLVARRAASDRALGIQIAWFELNQQQYMKCDKGTTQKAQQTAPSTQERRTTAVARQGAGMTESDVAPPVNGLRKRCF
jgi:hypothetical protein